MSVVRKKNIFDPKLLAPFKLSRTKIENFVQCPRCFYLDRRFGIGRPEGYPFNLNKAVDLLLKKEFDIHRAKEVAHPLMKTYGIDAVPFAHEKMDEWRENFIGVQFHHKESNFIVTGAVDDIWKDTSGALIVVDYKATSKNGELSIDADWQQSYKRQMELYQWLLRKNGFQVLDRGYFVYCNGKQDVEAFDGKLAFDVEIIPYTGSDEWVEETLLQARTCLTGKLPPYMETCEFCQYRQATQKVE